MPAGQLSPARGGEPPLPCPGGGWQRRPPATPRTGSGGPELSRQPTGLNSKLHNFLFPLSFTIITDLL